MVDALVVVVLERTLVAKFAHGVVAHIWRFVQKLDHDLAWVHKNLLLALRVLRLLN